MDNQNNTKVMRYLDGGDVCWFVFGVGGIVGSGSGSGGGGKRVHLVDHSTEILIPWPFQPPSPQMIVDCGVVEVGNLVVRAKSTAQRQNGSWYLPPPYNKKIVPNPLKKCSRHAIPWPFQTKPLRPLFDCHIGCVGNRAERSNSTARLQNEGDPTPPPPNKNCQFSLFKTEPAHTGLLSYF